MGKKNNEQFVNFAFFIIIIPFLPIKKTIFIEKIHFYDILITS